MSFPVTRPSMVSRLRDEDSIAWSAFFRDYAGPSLAFLGSLGVGKDDAEDIFQEVALKAPVLARAYNAQSRFHSFLINVLRNKFLDWWRYTHAGRRGGGKVISYDAPLSAGDREAVARIEQLADARSEHFVKTEKAVSEALDRLLQRYPDAVHKNVYLDWFWNQQNDTDAEVAARHGLQLHQLRYIRKKVEDHLKTRARLDSLSSTRGSI